MREQVWRYTCNYCGKWAYSKEPPSEDEYESRIPGLNPSWFGDTMIGGKVVGHYCSTKCHNDESPSRMSRGLPLEP